jgi:hypothetical protein
LLAAPSGLLIILAGEKAAVPFVDQVPRLGSASLVKIPSLSSATLEPRAADRG